MSLDIYLTATVPTTVFDANITHNLNKMADAAGVYYALWRPEEINVTRAGQLIDLLRDGLQMLAENPEAFKQFEPANKWGSYDGLVTVVAAYLDKCIEFPDAEIRVSAHLKAQKCDCGKWHLRKPVTTNQLRLSL